jgi:hypothetical protein
LEDKTKKSKEIRFYLMRGFRPEVAIGDSSP